MLSTLTHARTPKQTQMSLETKKMTSPQLHVPQAAACFRNLRTKDHHRPPILLSHCALRMGGSICDNDNEPGLCDGSFSGSSLCACTRDSELSTLIERQQLLE